MKTPPVAANEVAFANEDARKRANEEIKTG